MRAALLLAALAVASAAPRMPASSPGRYLYILDCGGDLRKVNSGTGEVTTVDLAKRLPIEQNQAAGATFDGCLMGNAVAAPQRSSFVAVVADQFSGKVDGGKDYHVYRFTLPELRATRIAAAGNSLPGLPRIALAARGVRVIDAAPPTELDLTSYGAATAANVILESSAGRVLLALPGNADARLALAVADPVRRRLVHLRGLPATTPGSAHLAPGGTRVWVEETSGRRDAPVKTGRAILFDATTGAAMRTVTDPRLRAAQFRAIAPNGRALYSTGDRYTLIDLGQRFPDDAVTPSGRPDGPTMFFAPR